ncbi:MAG: right-handed parallel beta-helix repeat-containing protein [Acidobacteriaceae bacterium]|nr:right-handed parallel beta-helix repeat-containing protein [Acidobacteriaceae bacterium]
MKSIIVAFACLCFALSCLADTLHFNCNRSASLQSAIDSARRGDTIAFRGACTGPLTIEKNLTLMGRDGATINGDSKDAITISGPAAVTLQNLDVSNGQNGIVGKSGAQLTLLNTTVHDNGGTGVLIESSSSATLSGGAATHNGLNGIDVEATSALIVAGDYISQNNAVFGLNINGSSSITFESANLTVAGNTLGIQIGTSAAAFIADAATTISVKDNITTGLTIVSGAHMVAFGGTIGASGNGVHGISVDSKAGFDLDAAATVTSTGNGQDGVHLEETSVLTMFNTPAFSGAPGTTTLAVSGNGANGISVLTGSNLTVIHQAAINSTQNTGFGIQADNGSAITLIGSKITGNMTKDVSLTFGSRGDIRTTTVQALTCDASSLLRGDTGLSCPR